MNIYLLFVRIHDCTPRGNIVLHKTTLLCLQQATLLSSVPLSSPYENNTLGYDETEML